MRTLPAAIAAASLISGFAVAQATDNRSTGGVVLLVGGGLAAWQWWQQAGAARATVNVGVYVAAFAVSHPLAAHLGAWPSVIAVSAGTAVATYAIAAPRRDLEPGR